MLLKRVVLLNQKIWRKQELFVLQGLKVPQMNGIILHSYFVDKISNSLLNFFNFLFVLTYSDTKGRPQPSANTRLYPLLLSVLSLLERKENKWSVWTRWRSNSCILDMVQRVKGSWQSSMIIRVFYERYPCVGGWPA